MLYGQYSIDDHMYLHHFILNPIFQRSNKFVLREVLRQVRTVSLLMKLDAHQLIHISTLFFLFFCWCRCASLVLTTDYSILVMK